MILNLNFLSEPWAITEDAMETIARNFQAPVIDGKLDLAEGKTEFLNPGQIMSFGENSHEKVTTENGIAIIQIFGGLYSYTYDRIRKKIESAMSDSSVKAILLKVKSPGGIVPGVKELSDYIYKCARKKHFYTYVDGVMCSAAYWLGSVSGIIAAPLTAQVGSIGVRTLHIDYSKWNEKHGMVYTHLAAGEYKVLGNEDEPLSKKSTQYFQDRLNTIYSIFVDDVARNLKTTPGNALKMANGKVYLAEEAKNIGLIHRIEESFTSFLNYIQKKEKVTIMNLAELKEKYPEVYSQAIAKGKEEAQVDASAATKDAVGAETERVLGLCGSVLSKEVHEKLSAVVTSGATVDQVSALADVFGKTTETTTEEAETTETTTRANILKGLENAHSEGVNPETGKPDASQQDIEKDAKAFADLVN